MFFKRKKKNQAGAERSPNPRFVDVRVTAIEPENFNEVESTGGSTRPNAPVNSGEPEDVNIRHTIDFTDRDEEFEGRLDGEAPGRGGDADPTSGGTQKFRPRFRPPMMVLKVMDDNQKTSELVRVRSEKCVLGRDEGDIVIAHDKLMSGRHAEIVRRFEDGDYAWHLYDLQSRNGTFVKIEFIRLRVGDELILGSSTFAFEETRQSFPRLVEKSSQPRQVKFDKEDFWIGRDRSICNPALVNDGLLDEKHAHIQFSKGRWCVKAASTVNGVWARIDQVRLNNGTKFILGEQRFQILIP